jgi:hypothetical protein
LLLADPVLATQASLISPDLVLLFFFLFALEGVWSNRQWMFVLGVFGLMLISMRGMMAGAALGIWVALRDWRQIRTNPGMLFRKALPFLPGLLAALVFLLWHYKQTGWIGYHEASPWAAGFRRSDIGGIARNTAVLIWRWLDAGRLVEWMALGYLIWLLVKGRVGAPSHDVLLLALSVTLLLSPSALLYDNLSAHRYFLPAFTCFHLLVFNWISTKIRQSATRIVLYTGCCVILASGHAWIYPRGVSMDWDCTLAHRHYHTLRSDMRTYLDSQGIDIQTVGSAFPNLNTGEDLMLNGDTSAFAAFDLDSQQYILTSNVFNDIDREHYSKLEAGWVREKYLERGGIWMALFRKKTSK